MTSEVIAVDTSWTPGLMAELNAQGVAVQVDADNQSWDSSSPAGNADGGKVSTARRLWWQGSYSLRIWGPEFLAVGRGKSDDDLH